MKNKFNSTKVSVAIIRTAEQPYSVEAFRESLLSVLDSDHEALEVIIVDGGDDADLGLESHPRSSCVKHLRADYGTRGAMFQAALESADGAFFLAVANNDMQITLRKSAVRTLVMAATRGEPVGAVYSDYELVSADGEKRDVHLLDWHEGRVRDGMDYGRILFFPTDHLRSAGGFDADLKAADFYDARLKASVSRPLVHVSNRYAGSLYSVKAPAKSHNVFDYLLADVESQKEMERVCTAHLERIGACLKPGAHVKQVSYTPEEEAGFKECIASVIIPVNNRPQFIGRAIESVQAQTVQAVEVIVVVNGGEKDPTCDAVRAYMPGGAKHRADAPQVSLIVLDINNLGLCFNSGLSAARGKYYVQLDSDDRLKPDAVEKIMAVYKADPTVGMVVGSYEVWNLDEKSGELARNKDIPVVKHEEWTADNGRNNLLRINGAGAPRSAHIKVIADAGWFGVNDDPSCRNYGEDYDLVLRISERYTVGRVWDPIYEVIRHSGGTDHSIDQVTIDRNDNAKDYMRLHAIHRRRRLNKG